MNPLHEWFRELGIEDLRSYQKQVPAVLHSASNDELAVFLRHLWATDGNVTVPRTKTAPKVYYASSSRELANGVMLLLARFGIVARLRQVTKASYRPSYHVIVADGPSLRTFCRKIGVHGRRGELVPELLALIEGKPVNTNVDTLPIEIWGLVKSERVRANMSERRLQAAIGTRYCGTTLYKRCPSRERLLRCADALNSDALRAAASSDIYWDRIVGIEPLGPQPVFDATVERHPQFRCRRDPGAQQHRAGLGHGDLAAPGGRLRAGVTAGGRGGFHRRQTPQRADGHRNGRVQGHYSRFVDMAPG
jgi:replicative DNA helicase